MTTGVVEKMRKQIIAENGFIISIFKTEFYEVKVIENQSQGIKDVNVSPIDNASVPDFYVTGLYSGDIEIKVGTSSHGSLEADEYIKYVALLTDVAIDIDLIKKELLNMFK